MIQKIREILGEIRPEHDYASSEDFFADGMLDSFDIIMLVSALDQQFAISIDGTEIVPENFRNLQAIQAVLQKHGVGE